MQPRKALGKGLASLIPTDTKVVSEDSAKGQIHKFVSVDAIIPNRMQPRHDFSEEGLKELSNSIKTNGIIQPLIVTPAVSGRHELIVGERRLRAARLAGLSEIPVIIKEADTETMLELAIVENVQRENLNPIEEARAYKELIETFDYTQDEVAEKLGKSRSHVANTIRLLYLPKVIQEDVVLGRLSAGHARALLAISDLQQQLKLREQILHSKYTVRGIEQLVQEVLNKKNFDGKTTKKKIELPPQLKSVVHEMTEALGTKIAITPNKNNKGGKIAVEYYSAQDLNRIYKKIVAH